MGLTKARGKRSVVVPDLYGLTAEEAGKAGGNAGVVVSASGEGSVPLRQREGTVISQRPSAGSQVLFGSPLVVVLTGRGGSAGVREPRRPYPPVREEQAVADPSSH